MNLTLENQIKKTLALAISELKNEEEALRFLNEFLSEKEFENLSKRLSVAYWLSKKRSHANIQNNLKVGAVMIMEGNILIKKKIIRDVIKRIDADEWADKWAKRIKKL